MADVLYLAVGSAGAAVVGALVAGAGTQIASDHRAFIARVWRRAVRSVGMWVLRGRYELARLAPLLPALAARVQSRKPNAAQCAHRHRRVRDRRFVRRAALTTTTTSGGTR